MLLAKECTGNNNNCNNKKKNNYYYSHVGTSGLDLKIPGKVRFFLNYLLYYSSIKVFKFRWQESKAAIVVETAGKGSFVYGCMQTKLKGQYSGKSSISLVYVSKPQITVITAIIDVGGNLVCLKSARTDQPKSSRRNILLLCFWLIIKLCPSQFSSQDCHKGLW